MLTITNPTVENINYVKNLYKNDPNSQDANFMESMDEISVSNQMGQLNIVNQSATGLNSINYINQPTTMNDSSPFATTATNSTPTVVTINQVMDPVNQPVIHQVVNPVNHPVIHQVVNPVNQIINPSNHPVLHQVVNPVLQTLSPVVVDQSAPSTSDVVTTPDNDEIVKQFAQVTGMNLAYSRKCLEENQYDADKSLEVFETLKNQNIIPADAFTVN